ncbi:MAG: hypothetical protein R3E01_01000 [Pirellulaceae bacterium]|nr:hypothetical protein [Planctomycetales bacterium]
MSGPAFLPKRTGPNWTRATIVLLLLLQLTSFGCGQLIPGRRLLVFAIEQNGQVLLRGLQDVDDDTPSADYWQSLRNVRFQPADESVGDDRTNVAGDELYLADGVTLRIESVPSSGMIRVDGLVLVRSDDGRSWELASSEADRVLSQ